MKYVYLLLLNGLLTVTCFSQTQLLFDEQFNDNSNNWLIHKDEIYECSIKNGTYVINSEDTRGGTFVCTPSSFDPAHDFEIETKITFLSGNQYGFGLFTRDRRFSKSTTEYYFILSKIGSYSINSYSTKSNTVVYKEWEQNSAIQQGTNSTNILTIKKTSAQSSFLINDKLVFTLPDVSFWGTEVGFVIYDTIALNIDYLRIRQDRSKINLIENKIVLTKENLGGNINSSKQEITPVITHDGKTLYFSVMGIKTNDNSYKSKVYYSTLTKDGVWDMKKNIGPPINNEESNFVISATADNNSLLLSGRYNKDGKYLGEGFSISHRTHDDGWSIPEDMIIDNFYNNSNVASYCLSADRKVLLLAIERADSYGQQDIYASFQSDNTWTAPKNIGNTINTFGSEQTPFLAADGKTLYFSTNGKPGYGDNDIFMSRRIDDSWTKWTEPVNLGPNVNTKDWDAYYTIPASGDYAYLVSAEQSLGLADIFRIKVAESSKPEPVVIIHGKVLDKTTKQPLAAFIDYHELSTGSDAGSARSNPTDGSYKIILPYGKAYGFLAEKTDFLAESDNIDLTTIKEYTEIERDLYLSPIEIGKTITLNNVFFVRSKSELLPGSYSELDRLVKVLTDNPALKIEISGHTDNVGDPTLNLKLSEDRVITIKKYLTDRNISAHRISGKGYGGTKPIASNSSEETRKLNRRVEFIIIGK